jgi:hypothetical protein
MAELALRIVAIHEHPLPLEDADETRSYSISRHQIDPFESKTRDLLRDLYLDKVFHTELIDRRHGFSTATRRWHRYSENGLLFLKKVSATFFACAALITPMWLMIEHPDPTTVLTITTSCIGVVGILLAGFLPEAGVKDVVTATAAYAGVLVIFVGTNQIKRDGPFESTKRLDAVRIIVKCITVAVTVTFVVTAVRGPILTIVAEARRFCERRSRKTSQNVTVSGAIVSEEEA